MHRFSMAVLVLIALCRSVSADVSREQFEEMVDRQESISNNRVAWVISGLALASAMGVSGYYIARRVLGSSVDDSAESGTSELTQRD